MTINANQKLKGPAFIWISTVKRTESEWLFGPLSKIDSVALGIYSKNTCCVNGFFFD